MVKNFVVPFPESLHWRIAKVWLLTLLLGLPRATMAEGTATKEYQIKAAFLFNFVQFIEWPPTAFTNDTTPIRIGVLGSDPFGPALDQTIEGETIRGRKLAIERSNQLEDLKHCQLIFIAKSKRSQVPEILSALASSTTVTVSDIEGFAKQGGTINFYQDDKRVRFEINPAPAQDQGLKFSSQLLSLGKIVKSERRE